MEKFIIKPHGQYGTVFGFANTLSGTYIVPGWYPVPAGTLREQVEFDMSDYVPREAKTSEVTKTLASKVYKVEASKPGNFYEVKNQNGNWSCSCPSASFHRGDCKHVKKLKDELLITF